MAPQTDAGAVTKPALASLQAITAEVKQWLSLSNTQANINICHNLNAKQSTTGKRPNRAKHLRVQMATGKEGMERTLYG